MSSLRVVTLLAGVTHPSWAAPSPPDAPSPDATATGPVQTAGPDRRGKPRGWANELYERVRPSVFLISCGNAEGTGFLYHSNRYVVTAFHVIESGEPISLTLWTGEQRTARVVSWDEEWDIALLEVDASISAPVLEPVGEGRGQVGDPAVVVGNPWGREQRQRPDSTAPVWALSQGVISAPPAEWIQTDAPVNPGNSGGPLLTQDGEVVGVLVVRVAGSDGISFAVSSARLATLIGRIDRQGVYRGERFRFDLHVAWLPLANHELSGVLGGVHAVFDQSWGVSLRAARLWGGTEVDSTLQLSDRDRWLGELEVFYRLFPADRSALRVGAGLAYLDDRVSRRNIVLLQGALQEEQEESSERHFQALLSAGVENEAILVDVVTYAFGGRGVGARLGLGLLF